MEARAVTVSPDGAQKILQRRSGLSCRSQGAEKPRFEQVQRLQSMRKPASDSSADTAIAP